jgi:hypothetical protein
MNLRAESAVVFYRQFFAVGPCFFQRCKAMRRRQRRAFFSIFADSCFIFSKPTILAFFVIELLMDKEVPALALREVTPFISNPFHVREYNPTFEASLELNEAIKWRACWVRSLKRSPIGLLSVNSRPQSKRLPCWSS